MLPTKPRALILTAGRARGALAALRALDRAGWHVGVGTPDGAGMVAVSRACARRHVVPRPRGDGTAFVQGVRRAVLDERYDVVFGGGDDWVAALATYRDQIPAAVAHPSARSIGQSLDKLGLARRAAEVGIAAPCTVLATAEEMRRWSGPVVVKCQSHWHAGQTQEHRIEARRFDDARSAAPRVAELSRAGFRAVLQQPVDGQLGALIGLYADGRLQARVQQVTSGLWPTPSGVSTRALTVPVDEDLARRVDLLLHGMQWSGLVELQFLTGVDGVPHLIDINARFYGSMALALAAGANLPDLWGRQTLGQPLPADLADARAGVRFLWTAGDLRRALAERRGGLLADVASAVRWFSGAQTSVWDPADIGPTVHLLAARLNPQRERTSRAGAPPTTDPWPGMDTAGDGERPPAWTGRPSTGHASR